MTVAFRDKLILATEYHRRLFRNRAFLLLWSGQTTSVFGDAFFNLAVMWVIWSETQSTLQTAIIQAVWHTPDILFAPLAGVLADRWDRKSIMVTTNLAAAAVVGAVAVVFVMVGHLPPVVAFVAVFKLNTLTTFLNPARTSVMPSVVGRDMLTTAQGMFSTARETASLVGSAAAGIVIGAAGALWAFVIDATSFLFVSLCIALARLPGRAFPVTNQDETRSRLSVRSVASDLRDGWRTASRHPVVRVLIWLGVVINVASFLGPLWPALVQERLGGGAASFGLLLAAGTAGGILGGLVAGSVERRLGAGRVTGLGWGIAGVSNVGMAFSVWLPVTMVLEFVDSFGFVIAMVAGSAIMVTSVPEDQRGRVSGLVRGLGVALIPGSALLGGWIAEFVEVSIMFIAGGIYILLLALVAYANPNIRNARI